MKIRHYCVTCFITLLLCLMSGAGFAHYPYPTLEGEKEAADTISKAVQDKNPGSVAILTTLLDDENSRIQTAALLGIMRLVNEGVDFEGVETAIETLEQDDTLPAFLSAAAESTLILLDKKLSAKERVRKLVALTKSEDGYRRRMGAEAMYTFHDTSVLPALEKLANDSLGDHVDSFDMRAVARVAFDAWWSIQSTDLTEEEKLPVLIDTLKLGEPYSSRWCDAACDQIEKEGQKAVALLIPIAKDGDRRSKLWARRTLSAIGGEEAVSTLLECCVPDLEAKEQILRQSSAYTISQLADERILPALVRALKDNPDPYVRERVASAIGRIEHEDTIMPLKAALSDPDDIVKSQAAAQLARKRLSDGDAILLSFLDREGAEGTIAAGSMSFISDQKQLGDRIVEILKKQPDKEMQTDTQKVLFQEVRNRILRTLVDWDVDMLQPMASSLKPVLKEQPISGWARGILDKLGE